VAAARSARRFDDPPDEPSKLAGVFAPISTPFAQNEDVDVDALRFNLGRYAESGLLGYLALGSNGENRSLAEAERLLVLDDVVRHKGPGQVVLAGAAYDGQREAERFLAAAADLGPTSARPVAGLLPGKQMTDEVLYRYFSSLADRARIPLLLYNAPGSAASRSVPSWSAAWPPIRTSWG
jgi:4-hydroxy-2-oxoglutarate aldolase